MIVTIVGHSYVRDLYNQYIYSCLNNLVINSESVEFKFVYYPGGKFSTFINNKELFNSIIDSSPDIIIVLLGGNDIATDVDLSIIKSNCTKF